MGAAVAYIIAVLGLMFYCKKRCKAKRLQKQPEGEEPEMECLNGEGPLGRKCCHVQVLGALLRPWRTELQHWRELVAAGLRLAAVVRAEPPHVHWKLEVGQLPGPWLLSNLA